ncbi:hypothetical protein D043_3905B, partial [Vibrio parahaemolyticus EKP-021]
EHVSDG